MKFDEIGGAIATDSSGRGLHATLVNDASFAPGILDGGLSLPATSSQYAMLPSGLAIGLTDFTVATWIKVDAFATWQRIFDFGTGTDNNMFLSAQGPAGDGRLRFSIRTPSVVEQNIDSTVALTTGVWTHVAVTRSGNTVSLYIDGSLAGSGTATLSPADLGFTTQNYLGKSQFTDPYLNSTLDDFRIYTSALSPAELADLANPAAGAPQRLVATPGDTQATLTWNPNATTTYTIKRATTSGGPYITVADGVTSTTYTDTGLTNDVTYYYVVSGANDSGSGPDSAEVSVIPSSLMLQLTFNETGGAIAADSSGHASDADLINAPSFGVGRVNNALTFNATSSQYATLPDGIVSDLTDFTFSTWVNVNSFATWQRIFDFGTGTDNYMFLTAQGPAGAGQPRFGIRTPSVGEEIIDSSIALTTGVWTHVAVTRSGNTVSIYVNGSLAGSGTATLSPADLGVTTQNYLAKSQWNDPYLDGSLDDFRIYGQAMSAAEIALLASPFDAPQNISATPGNSQISLSWDAVNGADGYTIRRAAASIGPYLELATGITGTSHIDPGLADGETWYYTIVAYGWQGEGVISEPVSATTAPAMAPASTATTTEPSVAGELASQTLETAVLFDAAFDEANLYAALDWVTKSNQQATEDEELLWEQTAVTAEHIASEVFADEHPTTSPSSSAYEPVIQGEERDEQYGESMSEEWSDQLLHQVFESLEKA